MASQPTMGPTPLVLGTLLLGLLPCYSCLPAGAPSTRTASAQDSLEDSTALLQHTFDVQQHDLRQAGRLQHDGRSTNVGAGPDIFELLPVSGDFNCTRAPRFCQAPFNCHEVGTDDVARWQREGLARAGRPNYQAWCRFPAFEEFAMKCMEGDLDGAAWTHFRLVSSGALGPHMRELDASTCFIEGFCVDTEVTSTTTPEEGLEMCDRRFGREAWAGFGARTSPSRDQLTTVRPPEDPADGFLNAAQTRPFVLAGCAMGHHHCDVHYCRETFCKDEHYIRKYGHHLLENGWAP